MKPLTAPRPAWFTALAVERQGTWSHGDHWSHITGATSWGDKVRIVLKDGTVFDGIMGGERNRWDAKHAVAIRIPGRKSQKWIARTDIAVIWGDKGRPLTELIAEYIVKTHSA